MDEVFQDAWLHIVAARASFVPQTTGMHEFRLRAWFDRWSTYCDELGKKYQVDRRCSYAQYDELLKSGAVDVVISVLGTTIKAAGSKERFRAVDHDIPLTAARMAARKGARHFLIVSSIGADTSSRFFYLRVKGELEDALRSLGFRSVTIVRPSILLGDRAETRFGEEVAAAVALKPGAKAEVDELRNQQQRSDQSEEQQQRRGARGPVHRALGVAAVPEHRRFCSDGT